MDSSRETNNTSVDDDIELRALEKLLENGDGPANVQTTQNSGDAESSKQSNNEKDEDLLALQHLLEEDDDMIVACQAPATYSPKKEAVLVPRLREDSSFAEAFSYEIDPDIQSKCDKISTQEELDSSDDEDVKNFLERKYNEYGCNINKKLKQQRNEEREQQVTRAVNSAINSASKSISQKETTATTSTSSVHIKNPHNPINRVAHPSGSAANQSVTVPSKTITVPAVQVTTPPVQPVYSDPVFGFRMVKPLVSGSQLQERMNGRKAVSFSNLPFHIRHNDLSKDWVLGGVLISKSPTKKTKKGDSFCIWRLSDLRGEIKMVSVFLFQDAYKELWKTAEGTCIAILNPNVCESNAERGDIAGLSINNPRKVMILGQSKDFGKCKGRKKNGDPCAAIVNLSECDYCVFHIKKEFSKMSRRAELQSDTSGRGLNELRNKILGKSEVFYGGRSFTAIPARKNSKLSAKDEERLSALSEFAVSPFASSINHTSKPKHHGTPVPYAPRDGHISKCASNVESTSKQRLKDMERLKILQGDTAEASVSTNCNTEVPFETAASSKEPNTPKPTTPSVPEKFKNRVFSQMCASPRLSSENFSLEVNVRSERLSASKLKAKELLKKQPIKKLNPNSLRGSHDGKRRAIDELNEKFQCSEAKRQKMEELERESERKSRIQRIMDAASSHANLVDMREQQEQDKYFGRLEKKEALEDKMLKTFVVPCKIVTCLICKYSAYSATEQCKAERHKLKVTDGEKRFYQCKDCGNRTTTFYRMPKVCCSNCKGSNWQRAAMIRDRKVCTASEELSVRGDEEQFIGSSAGKANLNLLVPDE